MKILFLSDSYMQDGCFDPFRQEVLETLSLYGRETKAVITNHFLKDNSSSILLFKKFSEVVRTVKEFNPDIIFTINRAGLVKSLVDVVSPNVLIISWFIDSYERVSDSLLTFTDKEIVWLTGEDTYAENFCNKYKIERRRIVIVPFAANINIFYPQNKERVIDGCFVGTAFSNEPFVDTLNNLCKDAFQKEIFLSVFEAHKKKYIFNLQAFLAEKGFEKYAKKPRDKWQVTFDDQISTEKRVQLLSSLNEFNIKIYGEPDNLWIKYLSISNSGMLDKYQYQPIKTASELSDLYNISRIGINIQHHQASNHSLPIRVFDIMACRTLLLTENQSANALNQIGFIENIDFVCFKDQKELRDKFNFYLIHEEERNKIVDSAYCKLAKYHSLKFRIQSALAQSLGTSTVLTHSDESKFEILSKADNLKTFSFSAKPKYLLTLKNKFPKIWEFSRLTAIKLNVLR